MSALIEWLALFGVIAFFVWLYAEGNKS